MNKKNRMMGGFIAVALVMILAVAAVAFSTNHWNKRASGMSYGAFAVQGPGSARTTTASFDGTGTGTLFAYMSDDAPSAVARSGEVIVLSGDSYSQGAAEAPGFVYSTRTNTLKVNRGSQLQDMTGIRVTVANDTFAISFDFYSQDVAPTTNRFLNVRLLTSAGAAVAGVRAIGIPTSPLADAEQVISIDATANHYMGKFYDIPANAGAITHYVLNIRAVDAAGARLVDTDVNLPIDVYRSYVNEGNVGPQTDVTFGYGWGTQTNMFHDSTWAWNQLTRYTAKLVEYDRITLPMTGARIDGTPFISLLNRGTMTLWDHDANTRLVTYGYWVDPSNQNFVSAGKLYENGIVQQDLFNDYTATNTTSADRRAVNPNIVGFKIINTDVANAVDQISFRLYDDYTQNDWGDATLGTVLFRLNVAKPIAGKAWSQAYWTGVGSNLGERVSFWLEQFTVDPTFVGNQTPLPMSGQSYRDYVTASCFGYPTEDELGRDPTQGVAPWKVSVTVPNSPTGAAVGSVFTLPLRVDMFLNQRDVNAAHFSSDENWYQNNLSGKSPSVVLDTVSVFKHLGGSDVDIQNGCTYYDADGNSQTGIPSDMLQNYFGVTSSATQTVISFYVVIVDDATPAGHSAVEARDNYFIVFDGARDGVINDPFFISTPVTVTPTTPVTVTPTTPVTVTVTPTTGGDSGGGGCAAFGFAPLALLLVAPVAFLARKRG